MDEYSIEKTAFTTHKGLFEYLVMAFGMCNAGASFQRAMDDTLQGLDHSSPYINDVITFSKEFKQQLKDLKETFQRIEEANFKIKTRKCRFGFRETKFLDFIVSKEAAKMNPNKCKSIQDYPVPRSSKDVKRFLGLASYYRKFIPNFADIAAPLNKLTQKNIRFRWSEICESSFRSFLKILVSPSVLAYPDFEKPFILTTDVSGYGLGAVLSQIQEGEERVICYASRSFKAAEKNYSAIARELLAIVWATALYRPYLYILSLTPLPIITLWFIYKTLQLTIKFTIRYKKRLRERQCRNNKLTIECKARDGNFNNFIYEKEILFCSRIGRRPYDPQIVKRVVKPV